MHSSHDTATLRIVLFLTALFWARGTLGQSQPPHPVANQSRILTSSSAGKAVTEERQQLLSLLRMTPVLTSVVARDPALLSNQQYVARNNPALAQFLEAHPEIAANPEFYLFASVGGESQPDRAMLLEQQLLPNSQFRRETWTDEAMPVIAAIFVLGAFWIAVQLIRLAVEHARWNRAFKGQTEVQGRLLDKFSTSTELIAFLETDAGKRLTQIPTGTAPANGGQPGSMVRRILAPLQAGVVLVFLGLGLQMLRFRFPNEDALVTLGTMALTLGASLAAAAAISWLMARHYGLLPRPVAEFAAETEAQR